MYDTLAYIVEGVGNTVKVIHSKRSDKKGLNWVIPDEHEKLNVDDDQIVARNLNGIYHGMSLSYRTE